MLTFLMVVLPLANYNSFEAEFVFRSHGVFERQTGAELKDATMLLVTLIIVTLLCIATIFLYRRRKLQIRLGGAVILLLCAVIAAFFFYSEEAKELIGGEVITSYKLTTFFPIVSIIFTILANRAIGADEALVRSADRIR